MNILISGDAGFIASKLKQRLEQDGNDVQGFDITRGQDILNVEQVEDAVAYQDVVFHLAAVADLNWARMNPRATFAINVEGTWSVAMACHKLGAKLFFASTCCAYGNQPTHPATEESLPRPAEIYAGTKVAGEHLIKGIHHTYGLDYNLMRFATIYGPGTRPALATHIFMGQALRNEPITVHGTGEQTRTLTYIDDLIDAIVALLHSGKKNDVWNLTNEDEVSAIQMAREIASITGSRSKIEFIPDRIGQTFKESISAKKMRDEVGWQAKVPFNQGISKMLKWFLETNQVENRYQIKVG